MLFNSLAFLVFATCFFVLWPLCQRRANLRYAFLVAASMLFYGWWDWRFLLLIAFSGLIDYAAGLGMVRWPDRRKWLLVLSLVANLGTLAVFKYLDFATANVNWVFGFLGIDMAVPLRKLILPVGISFYTFQSMSYTIDIYRRRLEPTRNILHFFAYLAMFPQLVAGPIVRAADLLPQLKNPGKATGVQAWDGLKLIALGYFKKVVLADHFAPIINHAFDSSVPLDSSWYWWLIMILFAYQIYCDFSGYSDIARGLAKWMGYEFPMNFNHPYIATGFGDFWRRWHISLSTWFRDYVYIPLGGNRRGVGRMFVCLWITMLLSGLWHGAAWTFVAWGVLHAVYLTAEHLTQWDKRLLRRPGGKYVCIAIVFLLVTVGWVFFRAETMSQAWGILGKMFSVWKYDIPKSSKLIPTSIRILLGAIMLRQVWFAVGLDRKRLPGRAAWRWIEPVTIAVILAGAIFLRGPGSAFLYFQF
jgi:alginate O-acetyltransferase complex protein AlgI